MERKRHGVGYTNKEREANRDSSAHKQSGTPKH